VSVMARFSARSSITDLRHLLGKKNDRSIRYNPDWDHRPSMDSLHDAAPGNQYYGDEEHIASSPYSHQRDTSTTSILERGAVRHDAQEYSPQYGQEYIEDPRYANAPGGDHMDYQEHLARGTESEATPTTAGYTDAQAYGGGGGGGGGGSRSAGAGMGYRG
jgi:hypothetical protein